MTPFVGNLVFITALLCAATMGYAVQRGATCAVAAIDEIVEQRRCRRLLSMFEAALWVAGGLLIADALHLLPATPAGFSVGPLTFAGGALLGLGAYVNRACMFGTLARFGSGQWAYAFTPVGFFIGCISLQWLPIPAPVAAPSPSPVLNAASGLALVAAAAMLARLALGIRAYRRVRASTGPANGTLRRLAAFVWSPHVATIIIGIAFCLLLLLVGAWAYTDVLAELARGMTHATGARLWLFAALFGGATLGGWTARRFRSTPITARAVGRCTFGGVLMGWGGLLVPGGNDGLILVGLPLLWPYAWIAFATMGLTIAAAKLTANTLSPETLRGADPGGPRENSIAGG